jgi:hypothetical protein
LLVVDRHFAVEHQGANGQLRDGGRDVGEPLRVVDAVAAQQADAVAILVRDDAPAATFSS